MTNKVIKFPSPINRMDELIEIVSNYSPDELIVIIKDKETEQVTFIVPPSMSIHEVSGRCTDVGLAVLLGYCDD